MARQRLHKNSLTVGRIGEYYLPIAVRGWMSKGKLSAIRLPSGHYRISIADFRDFLKRYNMPIKEGLFESESEKKGGDK